MANGKVTDYDVLTSVTPTDVLYLIRAGADYQTTLATLFGTIAFPIKTTKQLFLGGTPQTLSGAGTITVTETTTLLTNVGVSAVSVNDGLFDGHIKIVLASSLTNTATLTGVNVAVTSIAFTATGNTATLFWVGSKWWPLAGTATIT